MSTLARSIHCFHGLHEPCTESWCKCSCHNFPDPAPKPDPDAELYHSEEELPDWWKEMNK